MEQLVSVIVPVYNVQDYLRECLDKVCGQTYKNIEIILVDDGSQDDSARICDEYARMDNRIQVIHKENGGLSNARNTGIKAAGGDIISFIDSDDYPDENMISDMVAALENTDSDIVCCDYTWNESELGADAGLNIMSSSAAISYYLNDKGYRTFAWNKLYKRELFNGVEFPEGELFEDIKTIYKLFKRSDRVCYVKKKLYYYRTRSGSITNSFSDKHRDVIRAIGTVYKDVKSVDGIDYGSFNSGYISHYIRYIKKGILAGHDMNRDMKHLRRLIRKNIIGIVGNHELYNKNKLGMIILGISPRLFEKVFVKTR